MGGGPIRVLIVDDSSVVRRTLAEVLSADCYAAFEEAGNPFDAAVGKRYLDEILSKGGSRPALENFKAFRGREPSPDALLRHSGMIAA